MGTPAAALVMRGMKMGRSWGGGLTMKRGVVMMVGEKTSTGEGR